MGRFEDDVEVNKRGCTVLWCLACEAVPGKLAVPAGKLAVPAGNQEAIACEGGVQAVVAAMRRFGDDHEVQERGCGALKSLAVDPDNQVTIAGEGGIQAVVEAMGRFTDHVRIQQEGCGALRSLAVNPDNQVTIAAEGGIQAVLTVSFESPYGY